MSINDPQLELEPFEGLDNNNQNDYDNDLMIKNVDNVLALQHINSDNDGENEEDVDEEEEEEDEEDNDDLKIDLSSIKQSNNDSNISNKNINSNTNDINNRQDLTCNICNNKLVEPKLLSCLHVFCKTCLMEYVISKSTNNNAVVVNGVKTATSSSSSSSNLIQVSSSSNAATTVSSLSPTDSLSGGSSSCMGSTSSSSDDYMHHHHHQHNHHSNHHHQLHHHNQAVNYQHQIQHNHVSSSSSSSSTTPSSSIYISSIICPICKQETKLNSNGVDGLEDDYVMQNMLDMLAIEEMIISCTSCTTRDKAVARCADCAHFLCPNCVSAHQFMRCFENHHVVKFEDIKTSKTNSMPIHKPIFCKIHSNESLKYFCNTCDMPICTDCIVSLHQQPLHNYERIIDVEMKTFNELHALVDNSKTKIDYCQNQYSTLENCLAELQDQLETARGSIDETYQSYKAILEKRRDDMIKELEESHSKKELLIMDFHNTIDTSINRINDTIKFTERVLKNGNSVEILLLKKHICNQVDYIFKSVPDVNLNTNLQFISDKTRFEKAIYDYFGCFVDVDAAIKELQFEQQEQEHHQQQQQQQQQQLQQLQSFNHNLHQSPSSTAEQEWLMTMAINNGSNLNGVNQAIKLTDHFDAHSPTSPRAQTTTVTASSAVGAPTSEWLTNMVNLQKARVNGNGVMFDDTQQVSLHSPQSPTTTTADWLINFNNLQKQSVAALNGMNALNGNGALLLNNLGNSHHHHHHMSYSGGGGPQRSLSPSNDTLHALINGHQSNNLSNVNSRSQTPAILTQTSTATGANIDEYFNTSSMTQNLNQLTKLIAPQALSNINCPSLPSSSPPMSVNGIDTSSLLQNGVNSANNQQFAGNGNLNPPVRNGKMAHMTVKTKFGTLGPSKAQFNSPHGFCLGVDEEIVVADTNNHRIQVFEKTGEYKSHFGVPGREEGQLWYPRKVTVMRATGKFVVCDRGNERSRMQIFNKNGHFIKKIAIRYIDIVAGLAITNQGHIVAVDSVSPTVFRISEDGDLLRWFDCSDYMREPSDIAISGDEYYVCDFKGHCVVVFSEEGQFMRRIGGENITNFPNGIDISDEGDVLVGDSHGNRFHVALFSRNGELVSEFECPYVKVSRCCGLKITSEGFVVTLAKNNHHVLVLHTLYVS